MRISNRNRNRCLYQQPATFQMLTSEKLAVEVAGIIKTLKLYEANEIRLSHTLYEVGHLITKYRYGFGKYEQVLNCVILMSSLVYYDTRDKTNSLLKTSEDIDARLKAVSLLDSHTDKEISLLTTLNAKEIAQYRDKLILNNKA